MTLNWKKKDNEYSCSLSTLPASRPAIELPRVRTRSTKGFRRSRQLGLFDFASILALCPNWKQEFLAPSTARSTADAFNIVCRLDHHGKLYEVSQDKKQKVATSLLCDKLHIQNFAGPISLRASKVLGPISSYRIADILHHKKLASRASRPGLTASSARFKDFTLKVMNKRVELDVRMNPTLSPITTNAFTCTVCLFLFGDWLLCFREGTIFSMTWSPRFPAKSSIWDRGVIDAFVYAHHQRHHFCLRSRVSGNMSDKTHACSPASQLPLAEAQSQISASSQRSYHNTRKRYDFQGWAIYTDASTRIVLGETFAGWGAIARSPNGRIDIVFGSSPRRLISLSQVPELTPTTPLKWRLWSRHCLFSGLVARLPVMRTRAFIMTPNMLLPCAWARFKPAHMSSWHLRVSGRC